MPDFSRSGRTRGRNSIRLFRTYEIGSGSLSNSYAPVGTFAASNERSLISRNGDPVSKERLRCSF